MYIYDQSRIKGLEETISTARFSTYMNAAKGDREKALKLYLWNSEASAAFYLPLQGLEVALRNALHTALSIKYANTHWYDVAPIDPYAQDLVNKAKLEVGKSHAVINAPHVVAELSFGFWVSLLNARYHQSLWIPALAKAFPNARKKRSEINEPFSHLRVLRNRIAHHEPIFTRHLSADYDRVIATIRWINNTKADWIDYHSAVKETLKKKPAL